MERLWTRPYVLMIAGTFALFTAFYALYPTLPLFIQQLGGNSAHVGLAMGVFMLTSVALRPVVGGLLDRFGRRSFVVGGTLLFAVAMSLYGWVGSIGTLIALRVLHGTSWAVSSTATQTAITDLIPPARRGEGIGFLGMAMTMAMAVGPAAGLWIAQKLSYQSLFLSGAGISCVAVLLTFGAKMPYRPGPGATGFGIVEKRALPILASLFFLFFAYSSITTFVPLFASSIKVSSPAFFAAFAATLAVVRPLAGRLSDRFGEAVVVVPALVITILALITLSLSTGLPGLVASAVLYGIGFGTSHPVLHAATIRIARTSRQGAANASVSTAADLGIGLGAMALGWVSQHASYQRLFTVAAASVALSLLVFIFARRVLRPAASRTRDAA
jgi:MFS family permease